MTGVYGVALTIEDDEAISIACVHPRTQNVLDRFGMVEPQPVVVRSYIGKKRLASDGLRGVIADNSPIDATVVVLQDHGGFLVEVARTESSDGSWLIENLPDATSHTLALREGFNAGVIANLKPED